MSHPRAAKAIGELREVVAILSKAVEDLICDWESSGKHDVVNGSNGIDMSARNSDISHTEQRAVKTIQAALGSIESLVLDSHTRVLNLAASHLIARALYIAVEHNIAELLAGAEADGKSGLSAADIALVAGVDEGKICRIMRTLASHHIFREVKEGYFANNRDSRVLVNDEAFRANILIKGGLQYTVSDYLPQSIMNTESGKTAFQLATGTGSSFFDWMQEKLPASQTGRRDRPRSYSYMYQRNEMANGSLLSSSAPSPVEDEMVPRPEKRLFELAMKGQHAGTAQYQILDFPWRELQDGATVVDVGGGIGSFCMHLHEHHPGLNLVVQDREPVIREASRIWTTKYPSALSTGGIKLNVHDFFTTNPVLGADVYWLRHIIHDWADVGAIAILSRVAESMAQTSRLLIAELLMTTTVPVSGTSISTTTSTSPSSQSSSLAPSQAPAPLLPNFGTAMAAAHTMDLNMMMMVGGVERTLREFEALAKKAGLEVVRVWDIRGGAVGIVECRKV